MTSLRFSTFAVLLGSCGSLASADEPKLERCLPYAGLINSMALAAEGKVLATGSGRKTATVWDLVGGKHIRTFPGHSAFVVFVALSREGELLATASERTATLCHGQNAPDLPGPGAGHQRASPHRRRQAGRHVGSERERGQESDPAGLSHG